MSDALPRPVVFLAFANDRADRARYLRNLPEEMRQLRALFDAPAVAGLCELVVRSNATLPDILDVLQDERYRDRIAVFHFGGHADGLQLLLESTTGSAAATHSAGLTPLLAAQRGLQLVFLNGCSTEPQVEELLGAGVPAVIATAEAISDEVATELASRFYRGLTEGAAIGRAYSEAVAAVKARQGGGLRGVYIEMAATPDYWPWRLHVRDGASIINEWSLPAAAGDPLFGLPALPTRDLPESPYRHLQWFREEEAELFFGRGHEIRAFHDLVTSAATAPIVLFYGQAGVGKSSLLSAGVVPRLSPAQQVRYVRRDRALGLLGTLGSALAAPGVAPGHTPTDVAATWHAAEAAAGRPITVILDQVEEAFTRARAEEANEIDAFVAQLQAVFAAPDRRPSGRLVLGFRKEWLAEIEARLRVATLPWSKLYLDRLDRRGIVEIIEGPARVARLRQQYRLSIASGLAGVIADDLLEDHDAPVAPTLQVLLTKFWAAAPRADSGAVAFTLETYQTLRRTGLLLDDFVTEQLQALRDGDRAVVDTGLALDVLAFHTTPLGTAETRAAREVEQAYAHQRDVVASLIARAKDLYLLVATQVTTAGQPEATAATRLAHDTVAPLLRRRFRQSDAPGQRALRILESRADEWQGERTGAPLDEADLRTVEAGQVGMRAWTADEQRLVAASRRARRARRWVRRGLATVGVAAVTAIVLLSLSSRASERRAVSRSLAAASLAAADQSTAILLGVEASRAGAGLEASDALLSALQRVPPQLYLTMDGAGEGRSMAFSRDGKLLAETHPDSGIQLFDVATGRRVGRLPAPDGVYALALAMSPDGRVLAAGYAGGWLRLWDLATRQMIGAPLGGGKSIERLAFGRTSDEVITVSEDRTLRRWDLRIGRPIDSIPNVGTSSLAVSADGRWWATGEFGGTIQRWDATTRQPVGPPLTGHNGEVRSLAFSPDGAWLVSGAADSTVRWWELPSGALADDVVPAHTDEVATVAFSPDGRWLVSGGDDLTLRLWDVETRRPVGLPLEGHSQELGVVAFSPDGTMLASASHDHTIRLWRMTSRAPSGGALGGARKASESVAFAPDGDMMVTGDSDGAVQFWDVRSGRAVGTPMREHEREVSKVAFSPDGATVVSGGRDGVINFWDVRTRRVRVPGVAAHDSGVTALVFSPDGKTMASAGYDNVIRIWDVASGEERIDPIDALLNVVYTLAFAPDGRTIAGGGWADSVRLWNVADGRPVGAIRAETSPVFSLSFSPDGQTLATSGFDNLIRLWSRAQGWALQATLSGHSAPVLRVLFRRDGAVLASGGNDGSARLWDARTGRAIGRPFRDDTAAVVDLAFSPNGEWLASVVSNQRVRLWPASPTSWSRLACESAGRNLSLSLWQRLFPDRPYACTCGNLPPGDGVTRCPN